MPLKTWSLLPPHEKALQAAAAMIGVKESKKNSGLWIDLWLRFAGLWPGLAWCAAFVYWILVNSGFDKSLLPKVNPGSVYGWMTWAKEKNLITANPKRGDLGFWCHRVKSGKGYSWQGHIFFLTEVRGLDLKTIEGNTNEAGSREGTVVARRNRRAEGDIQFISLTSLVWHNRGGLE